MQQQHCRSVAAVPHMNDRLANINLLSYEILEHHTIIHPDEQLRVLP